MRAMVGIAALLASAPAIAQEVVAETAKSQTAIDHTPIGEAPITHADLEHWAFQPIRRPILPLAQTGNVGQGIENAEGRIQNAIDSFVLAKLLKNGLSLAPEAEKATLLRRLSFELVG